jgi:hypothetical protein
VAEVQPSLAECSESIGRQKVTAFESQRSAHPRRAQIFEQKGLIAAEAPNQATERLRATLD